MACKYYYNGKEFTEEELKTALLNGDFNKEAVRKGVPLPGIENAMRVREQVSSNNPTRRNSRTAAQSVASLPNIEISANVNDFNFVRDSANAVRITDSNGDITAVVSEGKIFLNPDAFDRAGAKMDSLGYVWMDILKGVDSVMHTRIINSVKGTQYETDSREASDNLEKQGYPPLTEEQILQRAVAEAIKDQAAKIQDRGLREKILDFFRKLGRAMSRVFGMESSLDFMNMTIQDYSEIAARSLMGSQPLTDIDSKTLDNILNEDLSTISIDGALLTNNPGWFDRRIQAMNKNKGVIARTLTPKHFSNARAFLKHWFTQSRGQKAIAKLNEQRAASMEASIRQVQALIHNFRASMKDAAKGMDSDQLAELLNDINLYLGGKQMVDDQGNPTRAMEVAMTIQDFRDKYPELSGLQFSFGHFFEGTKKVYQAKDIAGIIESMRDQIDELSNQIIDLGIDEELAATINANLGVYLHRSYAAFRNGNWNKKMFPKGTDSPFDKSSGRNPKMQKIYNAAVKYLMENSGMTHQEADAKLKEIARLAENERDPFKSDGAKLGSVMDEILKYREDLPDELRAFLGEYTDPFHKYLHTMENMVKYVENKKFLANLQKIGKDKVFFDKPMPGLVEISGGDKYHPLSGMYTTQEIADYINNSDRYPKAEMMRNIIAWWKIGKTAMSPVTTMRNFLSNVPIQMANGRFISSILAMPKGVYHGTKELFSSPDAFNDDLVRLGILSSGMTEEMRNQVIQATKIFYNDSPITDAENRTFVEKMTRAATQFTKGSLKFYEFMDNVWRISAFQNELSECKMMFPNMSDEELKQLAADRFKETNIVYAKAPESVKRMSQSPIIGTFPAFTSEAMRTSMSIPIRGVKDMLEGAKTGNTMQTLFGVRRVVAFSLTASIFAGLAGKFGAAVLKAMGFDTPDDDEDELLYKGAPEYAKNDTRIIVPDETGKGAISFYNLDFLNPWGVYSKAYNAYTNSDKYDMDPNPSWESIKTIAGQFMGEEALLELGINIANNTDPSTGEKIFEGKMFDTNDSEGYSKMWAIAMKSAAPGFATMAYKMYENKDVIPGFDKGRQTPGDVFISNMMGMKKYSVNTLNNFSNKMQTEYTPKITTALGNISEASYAYKKSLEKSAFTGDAKYRDEQLIKSVQKIDKANVELVRLQYDIREYARTLVRTGVKPSDVVKKIDNSLKYDSEGGTAGYDVKAANISSGNFHIEKMNEDQLKLIGYNSWGDYMKHINESVNKK